MLPWDLEDWLTEEGGNAVKKQHAKGDAALSEFERLLLEVWLFDTEARNGGVSQYFCNWGHEQWDALCKAAEHKLPSFRQFADTVNKVVAGQPDPYLAVIESGDLLDDAYDAVKVELVRQLQAHSPHQ